MKHEKGPQSKLASIIIPNQKKNRLLQPPGHRNIPPTMLAKRHRYLLPGVLPATNGGTAAEAKLCVGGGVAGGPRSDPASDAFLGWLVPSVNFQ